MCRLGISITRILARRHQKQPKRILKGLGRVVERLEIITADDRLDNLRFRADMSAKLASNKPALLSLS